MTKKELVKIIQEAVRREVKKEVKKIFIKENKSIKLEDILSEKETTSPLKKQKLKQKQQFSKNEALNKVLNETAGGIQGDKSEYPTMGGAAFDTTKMAEMMGYGAPEEVQRDMVAVDTFKKAGVSSEQVPEHITNALTRDYSSLMKVMNNKDK
jgi:hypothetical protein|tara:strand:- start:522 stop:980 length:459 start_codon:yes stop_codon:yes gene_type:complete